MMSVSFTVMVLCGIMMCRTLRKTTMSKKSKSVQKQLLKALVVQVLCLLETHWPVLSKWREQRCRQSSPSSCRICRVLQCSSSSLWGILRSGKAAFGVNSVSPVPKWCFRIYTLVPLIMTSYTVIDPITIILFVRDYREAVSCAHRKYLPNAQVAQSASAKLSLNTNVHFANPVSAPSC